jgi:hypothetical protein
VTVELVEVERNPAELDRSRFDDRVRGPGIEREVVVGLAMVVADPDTARVDVPGPSDASQLLNVDVSARKHVGTGSGEGIRWILGQHDGFVVGRHRVEAEEAQSVEVDLDRRLERANVVDFRGRELRNAPVALCQLPLGRDLGAGVRVEQKGVGVSQHHSGIHVPQQLEALGGLWAALGHVPECDHQVGAASLDVLQRRAQSDGVAVRVGDQGDPHSPIGGGRDTRAGRSG